MVSELELNFETSGEYVLEVHVTDILPEGEYYDDPITVLKTWNVTVHEEGADNIAPVVVSTTESTNIPHDGYPETTSAMIELSADGSDENEHDLTYQWFFNDLEISEASQDNSFSYEVEDQGLYEFVVRVCDCYTCTDLNVVAEVGEEQNAAPIANAGQDKVVELSGYWSCSEESCEFIYEVENLILDGLENSSDPEGDPLTYTWTKVGGPEAEFEYLDDSSVSVTVPKPESLDNICLLYTSDAADE